MSLLLSHLLENCGKRDGNEVRYCPWCLDPTTEPHCPNEGCHFAVPRSSRDVVPEEAHPFHGLFVDWRYRVTKHLGQGGFGQIYRAYDRFTGLMVAIKFLCDRPDTEVPEQARRHLEHEAAVLGRLQHPHIVAMHDVENLREGPPCLIMELLDGHDLEEDLGNRRRRPLPELIEWMIPVCEALQHAHDQGILHLDIKPSNLFLHQDPSGHRVLKVLDFGISRLRGASCQSNPERSREARVYGTPHYMAPEVAQGKPPDPTSDLYSLGVVLYEVLSGQTPFAGMDDQAVMTSHVRSPVPPLPPDPGIPRDIRNLVAALLQKPPRKRPGSAREVADCLRQFRTPGIHHASAAPIDVGGSSRSGADTTPMETTSPFSEDDIPREIPAESRGP